MQLHASVLIACAGIASGVIAQDRGKSLLLLVEGDARSVAITAAWHKGVSYREPRASSVPTGWIRLLDSDGALLRRVPFDLSPFNRNLATRGSDVMLSADRVLGGKISSLVKVPDLDAAARIEIDIVEGRRSRLAGSMSMRAVERLATEAALSPTAALTVKTHLDNGPTENRYDIVVLGDGYRTEDLQRFHADVDAWIANLFSKEPFKTYKSFFNVHSVHNPSKDAGADQPDMSPPIVRDTVYDATYNFSRIARCLYIRNTTQAQRDAAQAPDVEGRIVVFVNSARYGGCASAFAVSYNGTQGPEVQSHEFGHSFGALADEYGGDGTYSGPEPSDVNVTADSRCGKWDHWKGVDGVGCFEGGLYKDKGIWRPKSDCLMRTLGKPLCPVCKEKLVLDGYKTVNPIESVSPRGTVTVQKPNPVQFRVTSLIPATSRPRYHWVISNGTRVTGGPTLQLLTQQLAPGRYEVTVKAVDNTAMVRSDPLRRLERSFSWIVHVRDDAKVERYGTSCGAQADGCAVLPKAYARKMGESSNMYPHGKARMRYQQIFLGSEIGGSRRFTELCLRRDQRMGGPEQQQDLEVRLGHSRRTPATITDEFASNYSSAPVTVFRSKLDLPASSGFGRIDSFDLCIRFSRSFLYNGVDNLIVEVFNRSPRSHPYFQDMCKGEGVTTTRIYATDPNATKAASVLRNEGLVMCLRGGSLRPTMGNDQLPQIGHRFSIRVTGARPSASAVLWAGSRVSLSFPKQLAPGCHLYATPDVLLFGGLTDRAGATSVAFPIPNASDLIGVKFATQWNVIDPVNALGVVYSEGAEITIGG